MRYVGCDEVCEELFAERNAVAMRRTCMSGQSGIQQKMSTLFLIQPRRLGDVAQSCSLLFWHIRGAEG